MGAGIGTSLVDLQPELGRLPSEPRIPGEALEPLTHVFAGLLRALGRGPRPRAEGPERPASAKGRPRDAKGVGPSLRLLSEPEELVPRIAGGRIIGFRRGRRELAVARLSPPRRLEGGWWSRPWARDEHDLLTEEGAWLRICRDLVTRRAGKNLEAVELFDHYRGKPIPEGHVGLGYALTFRALDRTLEESEVDKAVTKIVAALAERGVRLRDG